MFTTAKNVISDRILFPKKNQLTDDKKPIVLILNSPFDENDSATKYSNAKKLAVDRGYAVINTKQITYCLEGSDVSASVKELTFVPQLRKPGRSITIWLEAHGSPGWLFGPGVSEAKKTADSTPPTHKTEAMATIAFRRYLLELEKVTGMKIDNIILNACYSATELVNGEKNTYLNSPARLLSILMPGINVVGFIGLNSSAKVTVFESSEPNDDSSLVINIASLKKSVLPLSDACIVFKEGNATEYLDKILFCTLDYVEPFVLNSCKIDQEAVKSYRMCAARETVKSLRDKYLFSQELCFADHQLANFQEKLQAETKSENNLNATNQSIRQ